MLEDARFFTADGTESRSIRRHGREGAIGRSPNNDIILLENAAATDQCFYRLGILQSLPVTTLRTARREYRAIALREIATFHRQGVSGARLDVIGRCVSSR